MGYYTGNATNGAELLTGIQNSAVSEGWTLIHRGVDNGGGTTTGYRSDLLIMQAASGTYLQFAIENHTTGGNMLVGSQTGTYNPAAAYSSQSYWKRVISYAMYLPCRKWHVFSGPTYVYVVLETEADHYRHFGGGDLIKFGNYVGGKFLYGHEYYSTSEINYPPFKTNVSSGADTTGGTLCVSYAKPGIPEQFYNNYSGSPVDGGYHDSNGMTGMLLSANSSSQFNRQIVTLPLYPAGLLDTGQWALLGVPPNMRAVNGAFINPKHDLIFGGDTWMCFPAGKRGSSLGRYESGNWFFGFLKSSV